jgi:hypothetical protein
VSFFDETARESQKESRIRRLYRQLEEKAEKSERLERLALFLERADHAQVQMIATAATMVIVFPLRPRVLHRAWAGLVESDFEPSRKNARRLITIVAILSQVAKETQGLRINARRQTD